MFSKENIRKHRLTCLPYHGLIKNTTSSKTPKTHPYSVAVAPFFSACKTICGLIQENF